MTSTLKLLVLAIATFPMWPVRAQTSDTLPTKILSDVVITGIRTKHDTVQNFYRSRGFTTTEGLLGKLSGITLIRRGAYGEDPLIRGLGNGQINVTIDGMRIVSACTDRMDPVSSYVDAANLTGIEGFTDASASAFGSTIGGALNLTLTKPVVNGEKITGITGIQMASSSRSVSTFGTVNASRKASAYRLNVSHRKAGNYRAGDGARVLYSQLEKSQVAAGGKWATGSYDTLTVEAVADDGWNIGFPALPMDMGNAHARIYAVTFQRHVPWWILHNFTIKGYHNRLRHSMDDSARPDVVMPMDMPGFSHTTGLFAEGDVHIFHDHSTSMKIEYFNNTSRSDMIMYPAEGNAMYMQTAPETTSQTAGLYLEQRYTLSGKTKLVFSMRTDINSQRLREGTGREQWTVLRPQFASKVNNITGTAGLSLSAKPSVNTIINFQLGYGERTPTSNERFGYYIFNRFDGFDYIGDPDLKKESALSSDGTFQWFQNGFELSISPFYKRISNYIFGSILDDLSIMTPGARGVKQYTNAGNANLAGADVMVLTQPLKNIQFITTFKYVRGTMEGEPLPLMPPLKIMSSLTYSVKALSFQADVEYASPQSRINRFFGEEKTPAFWIAGFRAGWKRQSLQLNAGIENLFNRIYREHLDWGGIPRPGRNFYLNTSYRF